MPLPQPFTCEVAIVGAGPAGSTAARVLARAGVNVALLDKARFPRPKTCGGGLLGRTLGWLDLDVSSAVEATCHRAELHHHAPDLTFATTRAEPLVSMVMRTDFDALLLGHAARAGAQVFEGVLVRGVEHGRDGVRIETDGGALMAQYVVGADGAAGVVARRAGFPELRDVAPALEVEVTVTAEQLRRFAGVARFDFGLVPHGYGWVFPKHDHLSVGVLSTRRGGCNLNDEYRRYVSRIGLGTPLGEDRRGYFIPLRPRRGLFARPRVLLVGDAAGLVDPITAEGISAAVLSGRLAAEAILAGRGNADTTIRAYRRALERRLLRDLRAARWLARGLYHHPRLRAWMLGRHGARLGEFVTDVVQGRAHYAEAALRPANYLKALFAVRGDGAPGAI